MAEEKINQTFVFYNYFNVTIRVTTKMKNSVNLMMYKHPIYVSF